jgi:hypothetical protein
LTIKRSTPRGVAEAIEEPVDLVDAGLVERLAGVADPGRDRGGFLFGASLHPDGKRGHLADHDRAERRLRREFGLKGLATQLDLVAIVFEDHDPLPRHPMLEAVGSRSGLAFVGSGTSGFLCIGAVGENAGFGGGHGRFLRDRV